MWKTHHRQRIHIFSDRKYFSPSSGLEIQILLLGLSTYHSRHNQKNQAGEPQLYRRPRRGRCPLFSLAGEGVRVYTHCMTQLCSSFEAGRTRESRRLLVDCRELNFSLDGSGSCDSILSWVMSSPDPGSLHVVLPSSVSSIRRLQCTLLGMGCRVSRVTKSFSARL